jgi:hypothetical protein
MCREVCVPLKLYYGLAMLFKSSLALIGTTVNWHRALKKKVMKYRISMNLCTFGKTSAL